MRILHLVHDWLFFDGVINLFETFDAESIFVCLRSNAESFKRITRVDRVESVIVDSERYDQLLAEKFDYVWVHYADGNKMTFVNRLLKSGPKVIWSSWGLDYVSVLGMPVYNRRTLRHLLAHSTWRDQAKYCVARVLFDLDLDRLRWRKIYREFFSRVSYFSSVFREEHSLLRRMVGEKAVAIDYHYINPKAKMTDGGAVLACDKRARRMWIGNSATYTNNHFDVFELAKQYKNWDVTCPLVYGGIREVVDSTGLTLFGDRWHPLFDFMALDGYRAEMAKCSVFVFGHRRQQSVGTISIALKLGGCVFLDTKNVTYQVFRNHGIKVYTLEDFARRLEDSLRDFDSYRDENVRRMNGFRGPEIMREEVERSIDRLKKDCLLRHETGHS